MKKLIFLLLIVVLAFNALEVSATPLVVIGENNREAAPVEYPYSAIAKISTKSGRMCTGFLILEKVLATNAHCLYSEGNIRIENIDITVYFESIQTFYSVKRSYVAKNYLADTMRFDFAFLELDEAAGSILGWLGTKSFTKPMSGENILQLSGYATDMGMGSIKFRQNALCKAVRPSREGLIMHDCDMETGSSGAPLFTRIEGKFYAIGINSRQSQNGACDSFHENTCFNLAIPFQHIGGELKEFLAGAVR